LRHYGQFSKIQSHLAETAIGNVVLHTYVHKAFCGNFMLKPSSYRRVAIYVYDLQYFNAIIIHVYRYVKLSTFALKISIYIEPFSLLLLVASNFTFIIHTCVPKAVVSCPPIMKLSTCSLTSLSDNPLPFSS